MLKTWSFWKTFLASYIVLVTGVWGFVEASTYFAGDSLKLLLGPNWWVFYYVLPLLIAFVFAVPRNTTQEIQAETLDQRNRRVMLNHVEKFWVKGILEKSLHGAALLELGIKEDPGAVRYPWTIKREGTNETLPAGKSMLKIFQEIGLGRSLLILGAPGSGKTTMLLELARQLIERARQDETEPIPVVFNLASWKEKQALADWLREQLNILYYVPKNIALTLVKENRMFLLVDGLDEVKQNSRTKCVEAINQFRSEHGLTSLVVCSRIEEYSAIDAKLSFEGATTLQPLTSKQVNAFFERFGESLAAVKGLLKKDKALQELAETPLMLSIVALAYKDINANELIASGNLEKQRKHLFDTYITRMFEHPTHTVNESFSKQQTLHSLNWLARMIIKHNIVTYQIEAIQPSWLEVKNQDRLYRFYIRLSAGLIFGLFGGLVGVLIGKLVFGLIIGLILGLFGGLSNLLNGEINMVDRLKWYWKDLVNPLVGLIIVAFIIGLISVLIGWLRGELISALISMLIGALSGAVLGALRSEQIEETTRPGQHLKQTRFNAFFLVISIGLIIGLIGELIVKPDVKPGFELMLGLIIGLNVGLNRGGITLVQHYSLRLVLARYGLLPWRLVPFLEHAVDLIFLRRVGGSYIFVHRLLMEHFAEMDV